MDDYEIAAAESSLEEDAAATEETATAFHEAAHAVAAWRLGRSLSSVSIVPDASSAGRTHRRLVARVGDEPPNAEHERALRDAIVIALAGPLAEAIVTGRYDHDTAASDHMLADELVMALQLDSAEQEQACLDLLRLSMI